MRCTRASASLCTLMSENSEKEWVISPRASRTTLMVTDCGNSSPFLRLPTISPRHGALPFMAARTLARNSASCTPESTRSGVRPLAYFGVLPVMRVNGPVIETMRWVL